MPSYRKLLFQSILALIICSVLVVICYYFVDKPVAFFVYHSHLYQYSIFVWMTYIAGALFVIAPIALILFIIRFAIKPMTLMSKTVLTAMVSLVVAEAIKNFLKIAFGRYWPMTWINNNPSLISNHAYGFHFNHSGVAYQSFPSGHTTIIFSVITVFWLVYPKWRWLYALIYAAVIVGLLGANYHFVSDVIAGGFLGAIIAVYCTRIARLSNHSKNSM